MRFILTVFLGVLPFLVYCQVDNSTNAQKWADSVYNRLSNDERIGQLIVTRLSSMDVKTKKITFFYNQVSDYISTYNIGGVCVFQGSPYIQAQYLNSLKAKAKTPLLISIDGEWGVGMRIIDSVIPLPKQMMLGAIQNPLIIYEYGKIVANQCKRLGIQMNYAPVMDVNNNPNNPVINDRSFGENKYKVAEFGSQYMKGMQDKGVLACAKHFPGHGDVAVDSHLDLPVINKSLEQLDSLELYPFKQIFRAGVGSVMIGHLSVPSIDNRINRPTSLSNKAINDLLKNKLDYQGIAITDGLEMQGVKKFFPNGESSVESLIAGNDLLCLPDSIPMVVEKIKKAIMENRLSWGEIENHCKRVLKMKYKYVLPNNNAIDLNNLTTDLNKDALKIKKMIAVNAITLIANKDKSFFPLHNIKGDIAYVGIGISNENTFAKEMRENFSADVFLFDFSKKSTDSISNLLNEITLHYKKVVVGIHQINRAPASNFGISKDALRFIDSLQQKIKTIIFLFGNAYATKNWCDASNFVLCYEDDSIVHKTAIELLKGEIYYKGSLPVTVCDNYTYGYGIRSNQRNKKSAFEIQDNYNESLFQPIDSIINNAISKKAMPGCEILIAKDGNIIFEKSYGHYTYENKEIVKASSVYDLASLTKILSTTLCIMKLHEEGKLDLSKKLGDYLPLVRGTDKENIIIEKLLLHEAGLIPFIPFYKETLNKKGEPIKKYYSKSYNENAKNCVANKLFCRNNYIDTFYSRLLNSSVNPNKSYVYSDIDFIFLGMVVEQISGMKLNEYAEKIFYTPMGLHNIGYLPLEKIDKKNIVPSTVENDFRNQEIRGYVHDQGAAIMGGIAGHAGLFSNASDISSIMQMLLNGGLWNDISYLKRETIKLFTSYQSEISRRGLGFDKTKKDNLTCAEPYPAKSASMETFGHTGFTGTCAWADPENDLIFVFLTNRIFPADNGVFKTLNIRSEILETIYKALLK